MPIRRTILDELTGTVRSMLAREVPERVLFLTGEAGIGKSTLIKQLLGDLETDARPPIVAIAECSTPVAGSSVGHVEALKPFADIMSGLVDAGAKHQEKKKTGFKLDIGKFFVDTAPSWIGLIPVIGAPIFHALSIVGSGYDQVYLHNKIRSEHAQSASNQEQVFRQYINFLMKLSEHEPVLVILDDFHWADTSSTNLLFAAARDLAAHSVVFLIVYRKDDIARSANRDEHPILHVRNEIERYSMSLDIEVPAAGLDDLRSLIESNFSEYVPNPTFEQWLLRISDGNMLFATQFLDRLVQDAFLEPRTAIVLKDLALVPVPSGANAVISEHIRRLGDDEKEQLRYASVEGETFSAKMASRILDMPMLKIMPRLRLLTERLQVIRSLGTQTLYAQETTAYKFVHFLVHKALYDDLEKEERDILHGIAADVLAEELDVAEETHYNVHIVAARLAAHAVMAQRHQQAAEAYLKGAEWVWRSYSADEALYLIDKSLQTVNERKTPPKPLRSVALDALLLKNQISQFFSRHAEAEQELAEAMIIADEVGTPVQKCNVYCGYASLNTKIGKHTEAETFARTALQIALEANDANSTLGPLNLIGTTFLRRSMYDEALDYFNQTLEAAKKTSNKLFQAKAQVNIGSVHQNRGNDSVSLEHFQAALVCFRSLNNTNHIVNGLMNIGAALSNCGEYDSALQNMEEALTLTRTIGNMGQEASILSSMSAVYVSIQRYDEALEFAHKALAMCEQLHDRETAVYIMFVIGTIYSYTNRLDETMEYFNKGLTTANEIGARLLAAMIEQGFGHAYLPQNRYAEALPHFESARLIFKEIGNVTFEMETAIASAWCSLKLEEQAVGNGDHVSRNTMMKSSELRVRTQSLMRIEDFSESEYESRYAEWLEYLSNFDSTSAE